MSYELFQFKTRSLFGTPCRFLLKFCGLVVGLVGHGISRTLKIVMGGGAGVVGSNSEKCLKCSGGGH